MKVSVLSTSEVSALAVRTLGLDETTLDLSSIESISASLRRAASFLCPASPRQLVDAVLDAVRPVVGSDDLSRDLVMEQLELLVASGDLLELRRESGRSTRLLFLGPPSYIARQPGSYALLGVRPFGAPLVGPEVGQRVRYERHTRTIELEPATARSQFVELGIHEIDKDLWIARPSLVSAQHLVEQFSERLTLGGAAGEVEGLMILDPEMPVRYYSGRWRAPRSGDTGDFVGRRPQAYGAHLWCFVRFANGLPERLLDLPLDDPGMGCDDAWRVQAAIDAKRGRPQEYRIRTTGTSSSDWIVDLFSPVPRWAQRYLELVGLPVERGVGSLISWRVSALAVPALERLLADMLWMQGTRDGGSR